MQRSAAVGGSIPAERRKLTLSQLKTRTRMDLCSQVAQPSKTPGQHVLFLLTAILITTNNDSSHIFGLAFVLEAFLLDSAYLFIHHKNVSLDDLGLTPLGNCHYTIL